MSPPELAEATTVHWNGASEELGRFSDLPMRVCSALTACLASEMGGAGGVQTQLLFGGQLHDVRLGDVEVLAQKVQAARLARDAAVAK